MLRMTQLSGFGASQSIDTTPAVITSDDHVTVDGNAKLAFTVTTDKATLLTIGGTDAAQVELASNTKSTTHVLRWSSDGVRLHSAPADSGANNVYDITITPTGGSPQSFAITVDIDWFDTFSQNLTQESSGWPSSNLRLVLDTALLSVDGTKVRLVLACPQVVGSVVCDALYIGEKAASGDAYDFASTPTQLLVGASGTFNLDQNAPDVTTDALTFTFDHTKSYVIAAHFVPASFGGMRHEGSITGADSYNSAGASTATTVDASGLTHLTSPSNRVTLVKKIQVTTE